MEREKKKKRNKKRNKTIFVLLYDKKLIKFKLKKYYLFIYVRHGKR